jgi:hypothetical protein
VGGSAAHRLPALLVKVGVGVAIAKHPGEDGLQEVHALAAALRRQPLTPVAVPEGVPVPEQVCEVKVEAGAAAVVAAAAAPAPVAVVAAAAGEHGEGGEDDGDGREEGGAEGDAGQILGPRLQAYR